MTLRPIDQAAETSTPGYPERSAEVLGRMSRWACRAGAVALASAALFFAGCRMAGGISMPGYFACGEGEATESLVVPGTYDGSLCEQGEFAWATFTVAEQSSLELSLDGGSGSALDATAHVIDPTGLAVAEVPADEGVVSVDVTAGSWRIAVIPGAGATAYQGFSFTLQTPAD